MNSHLNQLHPYPFARLREAMQGIAPPDGISEIPLYIGEPKHPTPPVLTDALIAALPELSKYSAALGLPELRQACAKRQITSCFTCALSASAWLSNALRLRQ